MLLPCLKYFQYRQCPSICPYTSEHCSAQCFLFCTDFDAKYGTRYWYCVTYCAITVMERCIPPCPFFRWRLLHISTISHNHYSSTYKVALVLLLFLFFKILCKKIRYNVAFERTAFNFLIVDRMGLSQNRTIVYRCGAICTAYHNCSRQIN